MSTASCISLFRTFCTSLYTDKTSMVCCDELVLFFFFQAEDGIRDWSVTGVQTCALPIWIRERLLGEPELLRTLVHEELGLSEESFPNPWRSTVSASVSTAIGGFIPIIPDRKSVV